MITLLTTSTWFKIFLVAVLFQSLNLNVFSNETLNLKRLDPHGDSGLKLKLEAPLTENSECFVCHFIEEGKIKVFPKVVERCLSCHNKLPHSGALEHLGKDLEDLDTTGLSGKIDCLSCHRPHRSTLLPIPSLSNPTFMYIQKNKQSLPSGVIEQRQTSSMLRRVCMDCHSWNNLP